MSNLKDMAKAYEPPTTKNIADLDSFSISVDVQDNTYTDSEGKDFSVLETEIDGQKYRIPKSVLSQLKAILEKRPEVTVVSVTKTGSGMNTNYTVIPQ